MTAGAEWQNRVQFAPFAEALGIDTDCIMSAARPGGQRLWLILYTETATVDPAEWIWLGVLEVDEAGILNALRRSRFKTIAEFNRELDGHMERAMKGENDGAV